MFGAGTMNVKGMYSLKLIKLVSNSLLTMFIVVCSGQVSAGPLNLANGVLEVSTGVEPNIVILNDDSGSMDHGVMAPKMSEGDYIYDTLHYQYVYPDPGIVIPVSGSARTAPTVKRRAAPRRGSGFHCGQRPKSILSACNLETFYLHSVLLNESIL